jgi:glyoxylase-like metal-dependent hydrolase (beta-lactamase superfamily II)
MIFRQLFDPQSSTYTYLLADEDSRQALLVDSVFEQARRDAALIEELGLKLVWTLETHVHADHVTGAWLLRERLGSRIALSSSAGVEGADRQLSHGERVEFGKRWVEVRATPGHTSGCVTYVVDDQQAALTGDALLIRGCGRTDFQQGSAEVLYRSIHEQIFNLPESCLLYPGHDYRGLTVTSVGEEKLFNPRLGGQILREDFVGYMNNLGLAHPKQMDIAVPANMRCGRPQRTRGIQRRARSCTRSQTDSVRRSHRTRRGTRQGQTHRHGMPLGRALRPSDRIARQGRVYPGCESLRRDAALACTALRSRGRDGLVTRPSCSATRCSRRQARR